MTRRGLLVAAAGIVLGVTGRMLGLVELLAIGAAMVALVLGAWVSVRFSRFSVGASRIVRPARVHAGGSSRVELTVTNTGSGRSPLMTIRDPFDDGRRWARFPLAPLGRGEQARAAYRLPTDERGLFELGPLEVAVTDPFGLATYGRQVAGRTTLTVFPHVETLAAMPKTTGADPTATAAHPNALTLSGEEFYALREYQVGDDLRRVHWPSTARLDEIMIRQDELPWQGRATVVVDLRRQLHAGESFEVALSAAASILSASFRTGSLVRMVTTSGFDSDFGIGQAHVEAMFEQLAAAVPHGDHADLAAVIAMLRRRSGGGGALAAVTTTMAPPADLQLVTRLSGRYGAVFLTTIEAGAARPPATAARPTAAGVVIRAATTSSFAAQWNAAVATAGRARAGSTRIR